MKNMILPLRPRLSEKAYGLSQTQNVYVFDVPRSANRHSIAAAVTAQFEVTVVNVNVTNHKGKSKRTISKGGRRTVSGKQTAVKKAYVILKKGDSLPFFASIAEEEAKQKVADEKAAKAAAKESPEKKRSRFRRAGKKEQETKS
ncbi:MAG TPA: 50S ribosomal protein L23 [Candidatus Saccharimonadales bacterium]|jgi:ribosomal protein L23|nr:50S ribosomal protein L23 [Candidatus Saccharimonadales bacterium]